MGTFSVPCVCCKRCSVDSCETCNGGIAPRRMRVAIASVSNGSCGSCTASFNTTHILTKSGPCTWEKTFTACTYGDVTIRLTIALLNPRITVEVIRLSGPTTLARYQTNSGATSLNCTTYNNVAVTRNIGLNDGICNFSSSSCQVSSNASATPTCRCAICSVCTTNQNDLGTPLDVYVTLGTIVGAATCTYWSNKSFKLIQDGTTTCLWTYVDGTNNARLTLGTSGANKTYTLLLRTNTTTILTFSLTVADSTPCEFSNLVLPCTAGSGTCACTGSPTATITSSDTQCLPICPNCSNPLPETITVQLAGITNGTCSSCATFNAVFVLTRTFDTFYGGPCKANYFLTVCGVIWEVSILMATPSCIIEIKLDGTDATTRAASWQRSLAPGCPAVADCVQQIENMINVTLSLPGTDGGSSIRCIYTGATAKVLGYTM